MLLRRPVESGCDLRPTHLGSLLNTSTGMENSLCSTHAATCDEDLTGQPYGSGGSKEYGDVGDVGRLSNTSQR